MANYEFQQVADKVPQPPEKKKTRRLWGTVKLLLCCRFADAVEYSSKGDTEN